MKIIVGIDNNRTIQSACLVDMEHTANDVLDMLRSGLTVKVIEAGSVTIGEKFTIAKHTETKL